MSQVQVSDIVKQGAGAAVYPAGVPEWKEFLKICRPNYRKVCVMRLAYDGPGDPIEWYCLGALSVDHSNTRLEGTWLFVQVLPESHIYFSESLVKECFNSNLFGVSDFAEFFMVSHDVEYFQNVFEKHILRRICDEMGNWTKSEEIKYVASIINFYIGVRRGVNENDFPLIKEKANDIYRWLRDTGLAVKFNRDKLATELRKSNELLDAVEKAVGPVK